MKQGRFRQDYSTLDHITLLKCIIDIFSCNRKVILPFHFIRKLLILSGEMDYGTYCSKLMSIARFLVSKRMYNNIKLCVKVDPKFSDTFFKQ